MKITPEEVSKLYRALNEDAKGGKVKKRLLLKYHPSAGGTNANVDSFNLIRKIVNEPRIRKRPGASSLPTPFVFTQVNEMPLTDSTGYIYKGTPSNPEPGAKGNFKVSKPSVKKGQFRKSRSRLRKSRVYTGPRGGRYRLTSRGTKVYKS